jgi:hypothetical protein
MNERAGPAYRDEIAAAYARIASLEADARKRAATDSLTDEERLARLEAHARRWDRVRTTLATVLGVATLLSFHVSERYGSPLAVLISSVIMVAVGVTLAWPSLSLRAAIAPRPVVRKPSCTGVRVAVSAGAGAREAASSEAQSAPAMAAERSSEGDSARAGRGPTR